FTALQRGHRLREGALSVQLDARRLRLLALEVFFLGTAIVGLSRVDYRGFAWPPAGTYRIGRTIPTGTVAVRPGQRVTLADRGPRGRSAARRGPTNGGRPPARLRRRCPPGSGPGPDRGSPRRTAEPPAGPGPRHRGPRARGRSRRRRSTGGRRRPEKPRSPPSTRRPPHPTSAPRTVDTAPPTGR